MTNQRTGYLIPTKDGNYKIRIEEQTPYGITISEKKVVATKKLQRALEEQSHVLDDGSYLLSELDANIDGFDKILEQAEKTHKENEETQ